MCLCSKMAVKLIVNVCASTGCGCVEWSDLIVIRWSGPLRSRYPRLLFLPAGQEVRHRYNFFFFLMLPLFNQIGHLRNSARATSAVDFYTVILIHRSIFLGCFALSSWVVHHCFGLSLAEGMLMCIYLCKVVNKWPLTGQKVFVTVFSKA